MAAGGGLESVLPYGLLADVGVEGPPAGQHFVHDDAEAEHVQLAAHVLRVVEGLGRLLEVGACALVGVAEGVRAAGSLAGLHQGRGRLVFHHAETPVADLDLPVFEFGVQLVGFVDHQVRWFQVVVDELELRGFVYVLEA